MAVYKLTDVTLFLNLERQKREGTEGFLNGIGCMERERERCGEEDGIVCVYKTTSHHTFAE